MDFEALDLSLLKALTAALRVMTVASPRAPELKQRLLRHDTRRSAMRYREYTVYIYIYIYHEIKQDLSFSMSQIVTDCQGFNHQYYPQKQHADVTESPAS